MTRRATNTVNELKAICWENGPLVKLQTRGIMPLQKLIEKLSDDEKGDLMEISEGIEDTLQRLHVEMPERIRAVTIADEFCDLTGFVQQNLKLLYDVAMNCGGIETPVAFEQAVVDSTKSALIVLNRVLESLADKFPGNEFEPIRLE